MCLGQLEHSSEKLSSRLERINSAKEFLAMCELGQSVFASSRHRVDFHFSFSVHTMNFLVSHEFYQRMTKQGFAQFKVIVGEIQHEFFGTCSDDFNWRDPDIHRFGGGQCMNVPENVQLT